MKKLLVLALLLLFTTGTFAQDADPNASNTVVVISNSTKLSDQADVFSVFDQYERPFWNSLVSQGDLLGFGHMSHSWGDEYNHNVYFVAEDKSAFFDAWDRYSTELDVPEDVLNETQRKILKHKDNIYIHTAFYGNGELTSGTVMLNQNRVSFADQGTWVSLFREYAFPILKEMVDEGKLNSFGLLLHEWGDEWNTNYYFQADDELQFHEAWSEYISTLSSEHPDVIEQLVDMTMAHKDNLLYERVPQQ